MNKLTFSTNDYVEIGKFIAKKGGLENPTSDNISEILMALNDLDALDDLRLTESNR